MALLSLPSTTVMSLMESWEKSSLLIVPVTALGVPTVYPVPEARVKITVSLLSTIVSAVGLTVTVAVDEPAAKVTVLLVPVRV
jgi:hypothetical protein